MTKWTRRFIRSAAGWIGLGLGALSLPLAAATPQLKTQGAPYYRFMLGDFEVTVLLDGVLPLQPLKLLQNLPAADIRAHLEQAFESEDVPISVNAYLVKHRQPSRDDRRRHRHGLRPVARQAPRQPEGVGVSARADRRHPGHAHARRSHRGAHARRQGGVPQCHRARGPARRGRMARRPKGVQGDRHQGGLHDRAGRARALHEGRQVRALRRRRRRRALPPASRPSPHAGIRRATPSIRSNPRARSSCCGATSSTSRPCSSNDRASPSRSTPIPRRAAAARKAAFEDAVKGRYLIGSAHLSFPGLGHLRRQGRRVTLIRAARLRPGSLARGIPSHVALDRGPGGVAVHACVVRRRNARRVVPVRHPRTRPSPSHPMRRAAAARAP